MTFDFVGANIQFGDYWFTWATYSVLPKSWVK